MEPDPLEAQSRPIAPTFFPVCPPAPLLSLPAASLRPPRPLPGPGGSSPPRQGRGSPARSVAGLAPAFLLQGRQGRGWSPNASFLFLCCLDTPRILGFISHPGPAREALLCTLRRWNLTWLDPRLEEMLYPKVSQKLEALTCLCLGLAFQGYLATYPGRGHPLNGAQVPTMSVRFSNLATHLTVSTLYKGRDTQGWLMEPHPAWWKLSGQWIAASSQRGWGVGKEVSNCLPKELETRCI